MNCFNWLQFVTKDQCLDALRRPWKGSSVGHHSKVRRSAWQNVEALEVRLCLSAPPVIAMLNTAPTPSNEGVRLELAGAFFDPDVIGTHRIMVDWGDGSAQEVYAPVIEEGAPVVSAIEFSDFVSAKRVGVDPLTFGLDNLVVGFDVFPDGTPVPAGTVVDSAYASVGVEFGALLTNGPLAGQPSDAEALNFTQPPNSGADVSVSYPNILSGFDPARGPNGSGFVAGTATLIANFVMPDGRPATTNMVGAFNDRVFGGNTLTAWSGPNGTGAVLGRVSATGASDFFGLVSSVGIASVTFSGRSTEIDDFVFAPVEPAIRTFSANHTFVDDGEFSISVTVTDATASDSQTVNVNVDNVVPHVVGLTATPTILNEGESVTLAGKFIDPGLLDVHQVTVDWGDGTAAETLVSSIDSGPAIVDSIEFADFETPKRVGVDSFLPGQDNLVVGFDVLPDGSSVGPGTVVDTAYTTAGVQFRARLTNGPLAGQPSHAQALDFTQTPNSGPDVSISSPNILSAVDPLSLPNASGFIAGTANLIVNFVTPEGYPAITHMVGAFNDLVFGMNTLMAWSGPDGSGNPIGQVSANGAGDFFGLRSSIGIASITFSGPSTEIDDLVFSPVIPMTKSSTGDHVYADDGDYTITVTVSDGTGSSMESTNISVQNVAPIVASIENSSPISSKAVEGEPVTLSATFEDPGTADTHTAYVNWGDGTPPGSGTVAEADGLGTVTAVHTYLNGGVFDVTVTIVDDDGGTTTTYTTTVITGAGINAGVLQIVGTNSDDSVTIVGQGNHFVRVIASFLPEHGGRLFPATEIDRIFVLLCDGNDRLNVAGNVSFPIVVAAGAGDDTVNGGGGSDVILGGAGNDVLRGKGGRDILIGGFGRDHLHGGFDEDILTGGTVVYATDPSGSGLPWEEGLLALQNTWTGNGSAWQRRMDLEDEDAADGFFLKLGQTVLDDEETDSLSGGANADWLLLFTGDTALLESPLSHWYRPSRGSALNHHSH